VENPVISLNEVPYNSDFAKAAFDTLTHSSFSLEGLPAWDFYCKGLYNQIVYQEGTGLIIGYSKRPINPPLQNNDLEGTFNLAQYTGTGNIWLTLQLSVQTSDTSTGIWMRGDDQSPWFKLGHLTWQPDGGQSLWFNISDSLQKNGQQVSSSTQFRIGTYSPVNAISIFAIGNLQLFISKKDIEVVKMEPLEVGTCQYPRTFAFSMSVRNNATDSVYQLTVWHNVDDGPLIYDTIQVEMAPNDEITYTFSSIIPGQYTQGEHWFHAGVTDEEDLVTFNNQRNIQFVNSDLTMEAAQPGSYFEDCEKWSGYTQGALYACGEILPGSAVLPMDILLIAFLMAKAFGKPHLIIITTTMNFLICIFQEYI
jgi:hypothetical protein